MQKAEILAAERTRVIDAVLRFAREEGYCHEVDRALRVVYPISGVFYDSEGKDCGGYTVEDRNNPHWCEECQALHDD